ncbi:MAG: alpha-(1-_3)-arabinofuranosyltransferase family protein, partial [Actinomycetes bacterium]
MSTTRNPDEGPEQAVIAPQRSPAAPVTPQPEPDPRTVEAPLIDPSVVEQIELVEIGEVASPTAPRRVDPSVPERERDDRPYRGLRPKLAERLILAVAVAIPFLQAPGLIFTDSRSDLTVNPGLFLSRVFQTWSSTYDLGHVQSGQFVGYIFPMAPFYAGGAATGMPMWVVQRVWLALILVAAGIGVSRLIGALWERDDGLARLLGGLVFVLNPYVVTQLNRGTITLTAYAVLPWLLYAAHRGMLEPRRWRWPIAAGFFVAMAGGGVNAAVLLWVMLAPLLLVIYEVAILGRSRRAAWSLLWRTGVCVLLLSLWWIIPTTLQSGFGADFLSFTEQPATIWQTNSVSESLRLLGYWITYFQIGFGASRPVVPPTTAYLFAPLLVAGSFAVPVLAFAFLSITWRKPYIPFFVLLAVGAIIAMAVGFPPGKPLNRLLVRAYYDYPLLQILRTTYKAAPLLAIALAVLVGTGGAAAVRRIRLVNNRRAAIVGLFAAPIVFGFPLVTGTA